MFFLRSKLEVHFNDKLGTAIRDLLRCPCKRCKDGRGDLDGLNPGRRTTGRYVFKLCPRPAHEGITPPY